MLSAAARRARTQPSALYNRPQHCSAPLSRPLAPLAAATSAVEPGEQDMRQLIRQQRMRKQRMRQLSFDDKLSVLSEAAASGSKESLEEALRLLQPSIFPEMLQEPTSYRKWNSTFQDPGVAAVKAGHPQLLGWLVQHCPGLMRSHDVLKAAAKYCDLAGLQAAWEVLKGRCYITHAGSKSRTVLDMWVFEAAAESTTPDTVAKLEWLLVAGAETGCNLERSTVRAAARVGNHETLAWLRDEDKYLFDDNEYVLLDALKHADRDTAEWGDSCLPNRDYFDSQDEQWESYYEYMEAAAKSSDAVSKWSWLRTQGGPSLDDEPHSDLFPSLVRTAVEAGQVDAVRKLLSAPNAVQLLQDDPRELGKIIENVGSVPMAECLRGAGLELSVAVYKGAAKAGSLDLVRWLATEGGWPITKQCLEEIMGGWPGKAAANKRDLLEAVQLLVGKARRGDQGRGNGGVARAGADGGTRKTRGNRVRRQGSLTDGGLLDANSSWTQWAPRSAMRNGGMALVQYLQHQRLMPPPEPSAVHFAAEIGCEVLLEWLAVQPGCLESCGGPYVAAAVKGDLGTLTTLRRLGVPWGPEDTLALAAQHGDRCSVHAMRWLEEHGAPRS